MSSILPNDEVTIRELLSIILSWIQYLKRKWVIILISGIIGSGLGFLKAHSSKPLYVASLSFALEDEKSGMGGALSLASQFGFDMGSNAGSVFSGLNLIELIKSRKMIESALLNKVSYNSKEISLINLFIDFNGMREKWQGDSSLSSLSFYDKTNLTTQRVKDSIIGYVCKIILRDHLTVGQRDKKVGIISVDVKSGNELFSKLFAESLVATVSDFYIQTKSQRARSNVNILIRQSDSIRSELNSAIAGVATANDQIYNLNPAIGNTKKVPSTKRQIDVQANSVVLTEVIKNLELAKMTLAKETPLIQIIDKPILPLAKEKPSRSISLIIGGILASILASIILLFFKKDQ
jgi:hypothetical protein